MGGTVSANDAEPIDDATLLRLRAALLARDPLLLRVFERDEGLALLHVDARILLANEGSARAYGVASGEQLVGARLRDGELASVPFPFPFEGRPRTLTLSLGRAADAAPSEADRELRRLQRTLLGAERLAHAGSWEWGAGPPRALRWSPGMYRLHGLDPSEPLTPERIAASVHEDDRDRVRSHALGGAPGGSWEYRVRLPDGEVRVLRAEAERARDGDERAVVIGFAQDVTDARAAEARIAAQLEAKQLLVEEIHHRVKNDLQLASSLLSLQERRVSPEVAAILRDGSARIAALALVHEKLHVSAHPARVDLAAFAEELARSIFRTLHVEPERVALDVRGGGVWLEADRLVPCGLLLNEMLFNALKHAFPAGRRGTLTMEVRATPAAYELVVRDDGCGMPERTAPLATLGLELLRRLPAQARGTLERLPGSGVGYRLSLRRELGDAAGSD